MGNIFLSPAAAAERVFLSRRTIMRAIREGELKAHRDNRAAWQIEADTLKRGLRKSCTKTYKTSR